MTFTALMAALLVSAVNPFIGSGGHGHVFVGADVPHGMVHAGPVNNQEGWDWCSGYHSSDSTLLGYAQTRLSGTGIADFGDVVILPQISKDAGFVDHIDRATEICEPGYYKVRQAKSGIEAAITAGPHAAAYTFVYPAHKKAYVKLDLKYGAKSLLARKGFLDGEIKEAGRHTIIGYRVSDEWAPDQKLWFSITFDAPIKRVKTDGSTYAVLSFGHRHNLECRVSVSQDGYDFLSANMAELADRSFDELRADAAAAWSGELSRIEIKGLTPTVDTVFATALYHTAMAPQLSSNNGEEESYTIFSLWDTYRSAHPLYNIIDERAGGYCNTLLDVFDASDRLPVWLLGDFETGCMVGVHSVAVLCEAALKGVPGVDPQRVLNAVKTLTEQPVRGMDIWDRYGYLPCDKVNWSVSVDLEYCIDAAAVARLARKLGDHATADVFAARADRYRRHFDPETGFLRAVDSEGNFLEPFDPSFSLHERAPYVEGNAWQYTFLVPHDVDGLAALFGGYKGLEAKLDALFSADSALNEGASADITGMIGQYAQGNEPSHHIAYLYTLVGRPDKAADVLRRICSEFYTTSPDGLIGNEDCGAMSAWYIFTALGFYPVDPASGFFVFGSPLVHEATIHTSAGTDFVIKAENNSPENKYIQSVFLNGKSYDEKILNYEIIMKGGTLTYVMGPSPKH